jgi:hypothetical protein
MALILRGPLDRALAVFGITTTDAFYQKTDDTNGAALAVVSVNSDGVEVGGSGGAAHVYADQQVVTASAVALTTTGLTNGLTIKAKSTNVGSVFVGPSGVTATDNGTGNGFALLPGEAISLPVSTSAGVFIIGTLNDIVYVIGS